MRNDEIKVSCECKDFLALEDLTEFQGGLKSRTEFDVDKIVRSIRKYGIAFPLFVWRHDGVNHCLDGHGRLLALKRMAEDGDTIPPLPVVYVDCKDERSARDLLLRLNSHYGTMTKESVLEFIKGFDIDLGDFELPCGVIDFQGVNPDDFGTDFSLADGDRSEMTTVTFTLHEKQKELIEYAMSLVMDNIEETFGNSNKNGNALYEVVREWAGQRK